jgi:hypothetical protein
LRSAYAALILGQSTVLESYEKLGHPTTAGSSCGQRHGLQASSSCILCCQEVEYIDHLLVQCVLSREVWFKVLRHYGWHGLTPSPHHLFATWWTVSRKHMPNNRCKAFDSLVVAVVWAIWNQRNDMTFGRAAQPAAMVDAILETVENWCCTGLVNRSHLITCN